MPAILNTNMASLYAQKNLSTAQTDLASSVQKLSSGKRINSAKDDAAGYAVAEAVKATKNVTDQSIQNVQDAISMVQTAEGALDVVGKILQRALTLTTEKENGSLTTAQKSSINDEISTLFQEIAQVKARTKFQGAGDSLFGRTELLSSRATAPADDVNEANSIIFTTGEGSSTEITIADLKLSTLFVNAKGLDGATGGGDDPDFSAITASSTLATIKTQVEKVSSTDMMDAVQINIKNRSDLGAWQNRLNYIVDNMQTLSNNLADAQSRIIDTDYASETAKLTRGQILQQAATSMLAQANQMPNVILTLLK